MESIANLHRPYTQRCRTKRIRLESPSIQKYIIMAIGNKKIIRQVNTPPILKKPGQKMTQTAKAMVWAMQRIRLILLRGVQTRSRTIKLTSSAIIRL